MYCASAVISNREMGNHETPAPACVAALKIGPTSYGAEDSVTS